MKKTEILLDNKNKFLLDSSAIGEKIIASGKQWFWEERSGKAIDVIVIHYISAIEIKPLQPYDIRAVLGIFCDYGVSSHYLINRRGAVILLVPEQKKAWHCGASIMPEPDNRTGVNDFSIGIELMATEKSGFTRMQYLSLCNLCNEIELRYKKVFAYVGHDQIAGDRAVTLGLRKIPKPDPGPQFDWKYFFTRMNEIRNSRF